MENFWDYYGYPADNQLIWLCNNLRESDVRLLGWFDRRLDQNEQDEGIELLEQRVKQSQLRWRIHRHRQQRLGQQQRN